MLCLLLCLSDIFTSVRYFFTAPTDSHRVTISDQIRAKRKSWLLAHLKAANLIARRHVTCEELGRDRYKRIIGKCTVAGEDMGAWMVQQGLALAYRRYSLDYIDEEVDAQAARRGIWASNFVKPWEWRRGKRLDRGD